MTSPRIVQLCLLAVTLLPPALAVGASTPYSLECIPASGIKSDPNEYKRVGYITAFRGMGLSLTPDIKVAPAYQGPAIYSGKPVTTSNTAQVVGVIEKLQWNGGQGDAIQIDFYVSQNNAMQLKRVMQQALKSTKIDQLAWWIVDYDQAAKKWYEQAYPASSPAITGIIAGNNNPQLDVNLTPVTIKNVTLYKVSMKVAPAASMQYSLHFATSSQQSTVKAWGLIVGSKPPGM
jgi:hypothetical protein